jgi:sugar/nucleoside kinase (ribokinase family)
MITRAQMYEPGGRARQHQVAHRLHRAPCGPRATPAAAASLGADGMFAVTADGSWRATPPRRCVGSPKGAGDAAVAGLLSAMVEACPGRTD